MLTIGLLGASAVAVEAVLHPARRRPDTEVLAVAARNPERAAAYAAGHGIPVAHRDYAALLADPRVDLVYIGLPPSEHHRWSLAALAAGKHVLCEKPLATDAAQARELRAAADAAGRLLVEAHHDAFHPLFGEVFTILRGGGIGEITDVEGAFLAHNAYDPGAFRHDPALGGGSLLDLGTYPLRWILELGHGVPRVLSASAAWNLLGADAALSAELRFDSGELSPSGFTARVESSFEHQGDVVWRLTFRGTRGTLGVDGFVVPHRGHSITLHRDGMDSFSTVGGSTSYDHQLDAVVGALRAEGLPAGYRATVPGEAEVSARLAETIDAVLAAARDGERAPSGNYGGVLFDCDGVLVDSEPVTNGVLREMLHELGWPLSEEECIRLFIGRALGDEWELILEHTGFRITPGWIGEFRRRRDERLRTHLGAIPGAPEAVDAASILFGGRIACATGADLAKARMQLSLTGLAPLFGDKVFSGMDQPRSKPAPDVYLAAAAAIGIDPRRALVVEDTVSGTTAGVAAGATVLGFSAGGPTSTAPERLLRAGAARVFASMEELPGLLEEFARR